jgi:predicted transcriptional regulator of viral defense system
MEVARAMNVLAGYTADQWGLVTTAQANASAIDNETLARLVEAGYLDRVRRGAYAATAAGDDPLRQQKAAWLLLNPAVPAWQRPRIDPHGGVLSHRTAALTHGVGDLPADAIEFIVPRRRASKHADLTFRIAQLPENDVILVAGLPVTTVERTIDDLIADHIDSGHAADIIAQALQRGQVDPDALAARLKRHAHYHRSKKSSRTPLDFPFQRSISDTTLKTFSPTLSPAMVELLKNAASKSDEDFQTRLNEILQTSTAVDSLRECLADMVEKLSRNAPGGNTPTEQDHIA